MINGDLDLKKLILPICILASFTACKNENIVSAPPIEPSQVITATTATTDTTVETVETVAIKEDRNPTKNDYCFPARQLEKDKDSKEINGRVIYGFDNRRDHFCLIPDEKSVVSSSTALVFADKIINMDETSFEIRTESYKQGYQLCENERFSEQEIGAFCSGSLLTKRHILTAAHCIDAAVNSNTQNPEEPLANMKIVFGFQVNDTSGQPVKKIPTANLFKAKSLVSYEYNGDGTDWAVVELDREVAPGVATPVSINDTITASLATTQTVSVAGYPAGLAMKYADDATIESIEAGKPYFLSNLDTYGGNSGSGVFDQNSGTLVGILTRGDTDFIFENGCYRSKVNPQHGGRGESVVKVSVMELPDQ